METQESKNGVFYDDSKFLKLTLPEALTFLRMGHGLNDTQ